MNFLIRRNSTDYFYDDNFVYAKQGSVVHKMSIFDKNYYKLRYIKSKNAIILEIDGLRMNLLKDFEEPKEYANEIVKNLKINNNSVVLDTCMGLGYTCIAAAGNAKYVITCEISNAVHELAKWNPFSALSDQKNIEILNADIFEKIKEFENNSFDAIIHDPPRFSKAGEVYSLEFYKQLYRVAKKRASIFHYVGSVGKNIKGRKIEREVAKRLREAGFKDISYSRKMQGLFFRKL